MKSNTHLLFSLTACTILHCVNTVAFAGDLSPSGAKAPVDAKAPVAPPIAPPPTFCDTLAQGDYQFQVGPIGNHPGYADDIVDWQNHVTEKPYRILRYEQAGIIEPNTLTVSGALWGTWLYEESNTPGKFPILSRFPNQHDAADTSTDRWILNNAAIAVTARVTEWVTLFGQGEFSDIEFLGQEQYQLRKGIVMLGNLDKFPFYTYFGRNTVDFGSMDGYNPFTHTVNNHSFRIDSDDPVLAFGFAPQFLEGFNLVYTAIPGGRHLRVADTIDGGSGQFDNFAVNASYLICLTDELSLEIGGGWIDATIYNNNIPHHPEGDFAFSRANSTEFDDNGAWDVNAELKWRGISVGGEFTETERQWIATRTKVSSLNGQVAYDFDLLGYPSRLSFVYGVNEQGPQNTEYEELKQIAVGFETKLTRNFSLGIEYVRNSAFVPLIAIDRASDSDVRTNTIIVGGKLTF